MDENDLKLLIGVGLGLMLGIIIVLNSGFHRIVMQLIEIKHQLRRIAEKE